MENEFARCLSDEQVLNEFVKRFNCEAAVLIYMESNKEFGFAKWKNKAGKRWISQIFNRIKDERLIKHEINYDNGIKRRWL